MEKRIIGSVSGKKKGPLLIIIGAIHGNEPAGLIAIDYVLKMLEVEPFTNPNFLLNGRVIGLLGNRRALQVKQRYIDLDLNRIWFPETIKKVTTQQKQSLLNEEKEIKELWTLISTIISEEEPSSCTILDIHTTSSDGGIFVIPGYSGDSMKIAQEMKAPVITKMLEGIHGSTLHYFTTENLGLPTSSVTFESGQHEDKLSINRAIAGIINCMRSIGMVQQQDVENIHDEILVKYSENLPKVSELLYKHGITRNDGFQMLPGFQNFQFVKEGELLAYQNSGPVYSPFSGRLLMPLYQPLGNEGFFIIKEELMENGVL